MEEIIPVAAEWSAILSTQRHDVSMKRHAFVKKSHVSSPKIEEGYVFGVNSWVSLNKGYWIYLKYFLWQLRVTNGGGPRVNRRYIHPTAPNFSHIRSDFLAFSFWNVFLFVPLSNVRVIIFKQHYRPSHAWQISENVLGFTKHGFCILDPLICRRFSREKKLLHGLNDKIFIQDFVIFRGRDRISIIF